MFSPSGLFYYVLFVCLYFRNWANFVCTQCVVWTFIDSERSIQWNCRAKPSVTLFALVLIATLDTKNTHSLVYYCRKNINYFHHKKRDHQWLKIYNIFSSFTGPLSFILPFCAAPSCKHYRKNVNVTSVNVIVRNTRTFSYLFIFVRWKLSLNSVREARVVVMMRMKES